MPTLAFIFSATALLSLALLLVLGSLLRTGVPGTREWFACNVAIVIALPLAMLRGAIPDIVSIVLANVVLGLSGALYYAGCARLLGRSPHWRWQLAGVALLAAALAYWLYVEDNLPKRVAAATGYATIILLAVAVLLLRRRPTSRSPYNYWFAAALAVLFAVYQAARGLYFMTQPTPAGPYMTDSIWNAALLTFGPIVLPVMTMAAIMMVHDAMMANVEDAANHDHMTGAISRRRLETMGRELTEGASRRKRALPKMSSRPSSLSSLRAGGRSRNRPYTRALARQLSYLLIDLDHFKKINDTYGHAGGDTVLREFTRMVRASLRDGDALGRLGGEEFGILLPDTDAIAALAIAERLREQSEAHLVQGNFGACHYNISIGVSTWVEGESFDNLSVRADRALYQAKNAGRNRVCTDDGLAHQQQQPDNGPTLADAGISV